MNKLAIWLTVVSVLTIVMSTVLAPALDAGAGTAAGDSNCCFAKDTPGCDDLDCVNAVCAVDVFCCQSIWDTICAGEAMDLCEICGGSLDCPWDCDGSNDGNVNFDDLLLLLAQWDQGAPLNCTGGHCDYNNDGCVEVLDLLAFLTHLTPDPGGIGCPQ